MGSVRPSTLLRAAGAILALAILVLVVAFAARDAIATRLAASELAEHDVRCESLSLLLASDLASLRVGPTRCSVASGNVAEVRLTDGLDVVLDPLARRVVSVRTAAVEIDLREPAPPDEVAAGMLAEQVPDPLASAMTGLASITSVDLPRIEVGELRATMEGKTVAVRELRVERIEDALVLTVESIGGPTVSRRRVELGGRLLDLRGRATASEATLDGRLAIDLEIGPFDVDRTFPFRMVGVGLDTATPSVTLTITRSSRLERIRARIAELREARAERRDTRQDAAAAAIQRAAAARPEAVAERREAGQARREARRAR